MKLPLFSHGSCTDHDPVNAPEPTAVPAHSPQRIVCLAHEQDQFLLAGLLPHLDLVTRCQHTLRVHLHTYYYPSGPISQEHNIYGQMLTQLEQAVLFLPGTSAVFLTAFWKTAQDDERFRAALARPELIIAPIPLRAYPLARPSALLPLPLAAYPEGHAREQACAQIAEGIARILANPRRFQRKQGQQVPLSLLLDAPSRGRSLAPSIKPSSLPNRSE